MEVEKKPESPRSSRAFLLAGSGLQSAVPRQTLGVHRHQCEIASVSPLFGNL
jgi:hypothetical protein